MKAIVSSFVQLTVIIMVLITLAVSSAAVAQWAESGETAVTRQEEEAALLVSDAGGR